MTDTKTEVHAALEIPLALLATMPERIRVFAETLRIASKAINTGEFSDQHRGLRDAYDNANDKANHIVNAFDALSCLVDGNEEVDAAIAAASSVKNLLTAIYKASGNIHNDGCFQRTFSDAAVLDATMNALRVCADEIREALAPVGR